MSDLTPKREAFCQAIAKGMSQADAYRTAFAVREGTKQFSIHQGASKLMTNPKIVSRVKELKAEVTAATVLTVKDLLRELEEARELAAQSVGKPQAAAMVAATVAKAKLLGLEAPQKIDHSSADGSMTPKAAAVFNVEGLSDSALAEIMAARNAQRK